MLQLLNFSEKSFHFGPFGCFSQASVSLVASATGAAISYTGHRVWTLRMWW